MLTFILGGARSGKSDLAQRLALASGRDVTFVATMEPGDEETRARIEAHRAERPAHWRTIEAPRDLVPALKSNSRGGSFVVVDCITLWVSNLLVKHLGHGDTWSQNHADLAADAISHAVAELLEYCGHADSEHAFVSNEVGLGVVPPYPLGRLYRDVLGATNRAIAARADRVYWLAAGLALELKGLGAVPIEEFGGAGSA